MNKYIFLTSEGYTFQPATDDDSLEIDNLQVIGIAEGNNTDGAFENLLSENPRLAETTFEQIFCYALDKEYEQSRRDYNLAKRVLL